MATFMCPACQSKELSVEATVKVRPTQHGHEQIEETARWDGKSPTTCTICGFTGPSRIFKV